MTGMNFFSLIYICSTFIIRIFLRNFGSRIPTTNFETTNPDISRISYPIFYDGKNNFGENSDLYFGFYIWSYKPKILCNFLGSKFSVFFTKYTCMLLHTFFMVFSDMKKTTYLILCAAEEVLLLQ